MVAEENAPGREAVSLVRALWSVSGRRCVRVISMMIFASLSEGFSIILLVPLLRMMTPGTQSLTIPIAVPLQALLGPTVTVALLPILVGFVLFTSLRALLNRAKDVASADLILEFLNRLRTSVFAAIANARWQLMLRMRVADLNHAVTADIDRVQLAATQLLALLQALVLLAAYVLVAFVLSPQLTLLAVAIGAVSILLLAPMRQRAARYGAALTEQRKRQYRIVDEFLSGLKVAKSLNAEAGYTSSLDRVLTDMRVGTITYLRTYTAGMMLFQITSTLAMALFVYLAISMIGLPVAEIVVMLLLFARIAPRLVGLQSSLQDISQNVHAFKTMIALRHMCEAEAEPSNGPNRSVGAAPAHVVLTNVEFSYAVDEHRPVIIDVSIEFLAGTITTILGPSGSGKSTVADLLLQLLEPQRGEIRVDGVPLNTIDRVAWRNSIAYVQQDTFLAHASIADNFRLSVADAGTDDIWRALTAAKADTFVSQLPDGIDTVVGERGSRVSGGERQRLALARALLRKPALLILDEATSSLDWASRTAIIRSIESLRGAMTIVAIDHGYGMASISDQVIILSAGRVAERGTPTALLGSPSGYLRSMQLSEGAPAAGPADQS